MAYKEYTFVLEENFIFGSKYKKYLKTVHSYLNETEFKEMSFTDN